MSKFINLNFKKENDNFNTSLFNSLLGFYWSAKFVKYKEK